MATKIRVSNLHTDVKTMMQTMVDENAVDSADVTSIVNTNIASKSTSDISEGTNLYYTNARADARVALIVDAAPGTLNTLNELAAALGDDANFSTTVTNSIATKLPLAGGTITGNVSFTDGNKAVFGTGSDLQVYHDGFNSYIDDAGQGVLAIRSNSVRLQKYTGEEMVQADADGAVILYHNNVAKFATSATGIDVTGTTTTDQYLYVNSPNGTQLQLRSEDAYTTLGVGNRNLNLTANRTIFFDDAFAEKMRINDNGNVGIGTATPGYMLEVAGTTRVTSMTGNATGGGAGLESRYSTSGNWGGLLSYNRGTASYQELRLEGSTIKIIESGETTPTFTVNDSKVGIGTTSPSSALNVVGANNSTLVEFDVGASAKFNFGANSTSLYTTSFYIDNTGLDIGHNSDTRSVSYTHLTLPTNREV